MMGKKTGLLYIVALILFCTGTAFSAGILPDLDDVYGTEVPSFSSIILKMPDSTEETVQGRKVVYKNVQDQDYYAYGTALQEAGCKVESYSAQEGTVEVVLSCKGKSFSFAYDTQNGIMTIVYPKGVHEASFKIPVQKKAYHNLQIGDQNAEVKKLQERLVELGYLLPENTTGKFTAKTQDAVRAFQKNNGVAVIGIAGEMTQEILFEDPNVVPASAEFSEETKSSQSAANKDSRPSDPAPTEIPIEQSFFDLKVGDRVYMGHYEQDGNEDNLREPIEWTVLSINQKDERALVLAVNALEAVSYGKPMDTDEYMKEGMNWENSYIRSWLMNDFYKHAFSKNEQDRILNTTNTTNDKSGRFSTTDKVYILSAGEVKQYLKNPAAMSCVLTKHASESMKLDQGAVTEDGYCLWWLRDMVNAAKKDKNGNFMKNTSNEAGYVFGSKGLQSYNKKSGSPVFCDYLVAVRPAMWIQYVKKANKGPAFKLTKGKLNGPEKAVSYSTDNDVTTGEVIIHSFTRASLNNDCTRFTLVYTAPEGSRFYIIPPQGKHGFNLRGDGKTSSKREMIQFDISHENLAAAQGMIINVLKADKNHFWIYPQLGELTDQAQSAHDPSAQDQSVPGTVKPVTGIMIKPDKTTLRVGDLLTLSATITPKDASNKNVKWRSSDPAIASVNERGMVRAAGGGDCEIICDAVDGSHISAAMKLHVPSFHCESSILIDSRKGKDLNIHLDKASATLRMEAHSPCFRCTWKDDHTIHIEPLKSGFGNLTVYCENEKQDAYKVSVQILEITFEQPAEDTTTSNENRENSSGEDHPDAKPTRKPSSGSESGSSYMSNSDLKDLAIFYFSLYGGNKNSITMTDVAVDGNTAVVLIVYGGTHTVGIMMNRTTGEYLGMKKGR